MQIRVDALKKYETQEKINEKTHQKKFKIQERWFLSVNLSLEIIKESNTNVFKSLDLNIKGLQIAAISGGQ